MVSPSLLYASSVASTPGPRDREADLFPLTATVDEVEARTHTLRFREILNGTSPAFTVRVGHRRTVYDPSAYAVDAGCSQYLLLRGPHASTSSNAAATEELEREALKPLAITNGEEGDAPLEGAS